MRRITWALGLGALVAVSFAAAAPAEHARPASATPVTVRLVPNFLQCASSTPGGMTHGPPLAVPSCSPPIQSSDWLTMVAPDRPAPFNQAASGTGYMILQNSCLIPGTTTETGEAPPCPDPGDRADVKVTFGLGGIRCVGAAGQANCAGGAGSLYSGKLLSSQTMRISDHYGQRVPNPSGADCSDTVSCPNTAVDLPLEIGMQCSAGACNYVTSMDLTIPGSILEIKRTVLALGQIVVQDAGADGDLAGGFSCPPTCAQDGVDHHFFLTQGMFIP